jgi:hypothetical protein
MNAAFLLQKLNKLDDAKKFISLLEIKFLSEEKRLSNLKTAKNSLDKVLIYLAFDIEKKLENSAANHATKIKISQEISEAFSCLKDFNDKSLSQELLGLIAFFENYETKTLSIKNSSELQSLKAKILSINLERFG